MRARSIPSVRRVLRSSYVTSTWATIGVVLLSGIAGIIASRALGPTERGLLATAVAWSTVTGVLCAYGTGDTAAYFVSRDRGHPPRAASTVIAIALVPGLAVAAAGAAVSLLLVGGSRGGPLAVAFLTLFPAVPAAAALGATIGLGEYRNWNLARLLVPSLYLIGVIIVVWAGWKTALAVTVVSAAGVLAQVWVLTVLLRRRGRLPPPSRAQAQPIVSYLWRSVVSGTGWLLCNRLDQLVLSVTVEPRLLGIYAVAVSLATLVLPIATSMGSVVMRRVSVGGAPAVGPALARGLALALGIGVALAGAGILFAPQLVSFLFGEQFEGAATSVRILLVGILPLSVSSILASTLRGLGRPLVQARAEMVGAVSMLILLLLLLDPLGIEGAAIAATISYGVTMLAMAMSLRAELRRLGAVPAPAESSAEGLWPSSE